MYSNKRTCDSHCSSESVLLWSDDRLSLESCLVRPGKSYKSEIQMNALYEYTEFQCNIGF